MLVSFVLSVYLYVNSFLNEKQKILCSQGQPGQILDFFMGRELNPRLGETFDLKFFFELRPGLIGWCLIDLAMLAKQRRSLGYVTNSLLLVTAFQLCYVADSLIAEESVLTTMDITKEGFGFMLAFGDLVWVPFVYSLQARYLVDHPKNLSLPFCFFIVVVNIIGFYIFRCSNSQKNLFRKEPSHPSVRHLKYLKTSRGTNLLIDGWWGNARHINYFGDLLIGLTWCLPCGFDHAVPYFYILYFALLLLHRERRDDAKCLEKYKDDWIKYRTLVKYRIVPFIY
ncbi:delta(14)-sterol reductase TM7SF2-like [Zophobas morio]|uniref:delta(14)-sterol reductase TM7SF2-like n=1 Tax=Zophobas morio TaxID=2755281 RepID=UPI003083B693